MEQKIKAFFEGVGKDVTEYLGSGASILMKVGGSSYVMKMTKERTIQVGRDGQSDIEITAEENVMNDLLSSPTMKDFREKMVSYWNNGAKPAVKILMERTEKNTVKFTRFYIYFLRRMGLLY
jgi:hypothetical protein